MENRKKVHVVIHVSFVGPAYFAEYLMEKDVELSFTDLSKGESLPRDFDFDMLLIMGGPMGVHDVDTCPWMTEELGLIRKAISRKKRVLGICLGAQLIAKALGAKVEINTESEVGWWPVKKTEWADVHPLCKDWPRSFSTLHWHQEVFSLPPDAISLFESEVTPCQAFVYTDRVVGLQFHPEMTEYMLTDYMRFYSDNLEDGGQYVSTSKDMFARTQFAINHEVCRSVVDFLLAKT